MALKLTAADPPGERVARLWLGADDYLAKPIHFPELVLRRCRRRLRDHPGPGEALRVMPAVRDHGILTARRLAPWRQLSVAPRRRSECGAIAVELASTRSTPAAVKVCTS